MIYGRLFLSSPNAALFFNAGYRGGTVCVLGSLGCGCCDDDGTVGKNTHIVHDLEVCLEIGFPLDSLCCVVVWTIVERYRLQSNYLEAMWIPLRELVCRLRQHFARRNVNHFTVKLISPLPLSEYFALIDCHFDVRCELL